MRSGFLPGVVTAALLCSSLFAGTITVSNLNDTGTGSLRNAIIANNALGGGNTINFAAGVVGTITLQTGQLEISADTTIVGPGARLLAIDGNATQRVFDVSVAANVNISGLSIIRGHSVQAPGGGIHLSGGQLALTNCTITGNIADPGEGGGIEVAAGGTGTFTGCTFSNNTAKFSSTASTFTGDGGGIAAYGSVTVTNCTFAGNIANEKGGGICAVNSALTIKSCTFSTNTGGSAGGGIAEIGGGSSITIQNTIVAGNSPGIGGGPDVYGGVNSQGFNLIGSHLQTSGFTAPGDRVDVAASLSALHNNGGPTDTMMPVAGSLAIDNGSSGLSTDQRGYSRPIDQPAGNGSGSDGSDIGAVEVQALQSGPNFVVTTTDEHSNSQCEIVNCSLWDAATASDNNTANNSVITFASGVTGTIRVTIQPAGMFLTRPVNIVGPGARSLALNAGGAGRIFSVSGQNVVISGLTLTQGFTQGGTGGAITNDGGLTLNDCEIDNNSAHATSQFAPNGGAIQNNSGASLTVNRCTFYSNDAAVLGGAIQNAGTLTATNATFSHNVAEGGGAVDNFGGTATLVNCTITGNAAIGGASGDEGAGVRNQGGSCTLINTIVANNVADDGKTVDLDGAFSSGGGNLVGRIDGATSFTNSDPTHPDKTGTNATPLNPGFADYGDHGGPTNTEALAAGSIAIDSANPTRAPSTDQRGFGRVGAADIGAFEFNGTIPVTLANISTRLPVQTGDNVLIGGFIVTGTQPKKVIIRALGPSVPVPGALADPVLELYQGNTLLESNDNWVDSPNKQAIIDSTIPPSNNLESAIVRTLPANGTGYTAIVRGVNNGTGIGVVEAYDLDRSVDSKLANISTRGFVQTGDNVLIAGTIILGQIPQKVIIRALGPSTGVPGAMADPTLELHDGNGTTLETNDNWVDSPNKQAIIDSTIPPPNNLESAIVRTLAPASYTAIVRGVNSSTGIAVVEVYALN